MTSDLRCPPEGRDWKRWFAGWEGSEMILFACFVTCCKEMDSVEGKGERMIFKGLGDYAL